jgi:dTMP kinase
MWAADRLAQQEHEIIPEMLRGRSVICDRWYHSSIAYQAGGVVTQEWIRNINRHALTPDLTIFLEVTPETARQRIANRAEGRGIFDDHLDRVSDGYRRSVDLLRRHQENILILDGANDRADISAQILSAIRHICRN